MIRRALIILTGLALVVSVLIGVALSPILIAELGRLFEFDAKYASRLGGAYGAASALLSAIALCGVAFATFLQVRQMHIGQLHAVRALQLELLRIAMEKPEYRAMLGDGFKSLSPAAWREHAYLNLWVMYLQMGFLTGAISEGGVRRIVHGEIFASGRGLGYWTTVEPSFRAEAATRKHRRFVTILCEEHEKAAIATASGAMEAARVE
jgi:hypothetical protein